MSERFNRPRTPPGPPPSSHSRKSSGRGPGSSSNSSKSLAPKSYSDRSYDKYDKTYKSSAYQSSKDYSDDKYKSGKLSDKVTGSKYASKNLYIDDDFKVGSSMYASSQRYSENKDGYSTKFSEKGRYGSDDKYNITSSTGSSSTSQYGNKKYDDYGSYPDKTSRYPKQDSSSSYYGSSYDSYSSYDGYGADRQRSGGGYSGDRAGVGPVSYSSGSRIGGSYGANKVSGGNLGYGGDKLSRGGNSSYGGDKHSRGGGSGYGGEKHGSSNLGYGDTKSGVGGRSRLYGDDDRRVYSGSYSPSRTGSRSDVRTYGGGYDDYSYGSSSSARSSEKQYLDRYVIGDSVVYGPPGQYPRNLQSSSSPSRRPPSPPSPPLLNRSSYSSRYSTSSPRRYASGRRSLTPTTSAYRSLSPSSRRPPSPPSSRRPPSPDSLYSRGRDRSYDSGRTKEGRYNNKTGTSRSPARDSNRNVDRRDDGRLRADDRSRRDTNRSLGSREKDSLDSNKRPRIGDHRNVDYHGTSGTRSWGKEGYGQRDDRNQHNSPTRNAHRDSRNNSRDRAGRRIEDRLSINPPSGSRRSPAPRPRMGRNAASPRDGNNKKPRRPDDLRLWIESRKNEGGKKGASQAHGRPLGKGVAARSGDRSKLKRPRLGDPKRRLGGGKARRTGGPLRRNKILKKYKRMAAKRGMRSGAVGGIGSRNSNRSNREGGGNRRGEGGEGDHTEDVENSKPGSTASIHRVIKKPSRVSLENDLEIRPRVMGKRTKKLLKDPKEDDDGSRIPSDGR